MGKANSIKNAIGIDSSCINKIRKPDTAATGRFKWKTPYGGEFFADFEIKINGLRGSIRVEFDWNTPTNIVHVVNNIQMVGCLTPYKTIRWSFFCPIKKLCNKRSFYKLYIMNDKRMGCKRCAKLYYKKEMEDHRLRGLISKNPGLIKKILSSPFERIRNKIYAIDAYFVLVRKLERYQRILAELQPPPIEKPKGRPQRHQPSRKIWMLWPPAGQKNQPLSEPRAQVSETSQPNPTISAPLQPNRKPEP